MATSGYAMAPYSGHERHTRSATAIEAKPIATKSALSCFSA